MELIIFIVATTAWFFTWKQLSKMYISKGHNKAISHFGAASLGFFIFVFIIILALPSQPEDSQGKSKHVVTQKDLGDKWPFTYTQATLECFTDNDIKSPLVTVNGTRYGLTGFADSMYGVGDINAINAIWLEDKDMGEGVHVNLGPITKKALELCK